MPSKIQRVVLALAVGMIRGRLKNARSVLTGSLAVTVRILHAHHHQVRRFGRYISFADHKTSIAGFHLDSVISDAQPDLEAKRPAKPVSGSSHIGIRKHR